MYVLMCRAALPSKSMLVRGYDPKFDRAILCGREILRTTMILRSESSRFWSHHLGVRQCYLVPVESTGTAGTVPVVFSRKKEFRWNLVPVVFGFGVFVALKITLVCIYVSGDSI